MTEDKDTGPQASTPAPTSPNPADFSAQLEHPVYELVEKGAKPQGYETRDIKPDEHN
jgi:hypothetical protein